MNKDRSWMEYFRLVTPFLLAIIGWYVAGIDGKINSLNSRVSEMDNKMFKHLTNDELHCPRSLMMPKAEWQIYDSMLSKQLCSINNEIVEIKNYILKKEIMMNRR